MQKSARAMGRKVLKEVKNYNSSKYSKLDKSTDTNNKGGYKKLLNSFSLERKKERRVSERILDDFQAKTHDKNEKEKPIMRNKMTQTKSNSK